MQPNSHAFEVYPSAYPPDVVRIEADSREEAAELWVASADLPLARRGDLSLLTIDGEEYLATSTRNGGEDATE